jgi:hypothetical protein
MRTAQTIPEPVTEGLNARFYKQRAVESPYIINSLLLSMNYKIVLPVLALVFVAGSAMFLRGGNDRVANVTDDVPVTQTDDSVPAVPGESDDVAVQDTPTEVAVDNSVDGLLAEFSSDISSEQVAYADDGIDENAFAHTELSGFESDSYDI